MKKSVIRVIILPVLCAGIVMLLGSYTVKSAEKKNGIEGICYEFEGDNDYDIASGSIIDALHDHEVCQAV